MAVAAEIQSQPWLLAREAFAEADRRASVEAQMFLGGIALGGCVEKAESTNDTTMLAAVQLAALGDRSARAMVEANVSTDGAERLYKVAHQTKVCLSFENGHLQQQGRRLATINRNALEHTVLIPEMQRRATIELKNALLFETLQAEGALLTHDAFVFSTTSTEMSAQQKTDYGLFADTESCSIQQLSVTGNQATLETAFVAGKKMPTSERQDIRVITQLAERAGALITTEDGTDMLQYVVLVPKSELPNGVVDMVELYDDMAGGTFYGQAKPRQDYLEYAQTCERRNESFSDVVQNITEQLLAEAHLYTSPLEVIMRLDELSERFCVKYAASNREVDAAVFGKSSAMHLNEYRLFMEQGQPDRAQASLVKAQNTATSSSCPLFKKASESADSSPDAGPKTEESSGKKSMNCPFCKAKVFDDPCAKRLSCWDCKALVVNGALKSKGDGGSRARAERQVTKPITAKQLQTSGV